MYRTDKQFMKNPATNSSRIYIGSLPKTIVADDLEAKFKVHGTILGLLLHSGFAFIQYEHDYEAQKAIEKEHGTNLHGHKINVKQAADRSQKGMNQQQQRPPPPQQFQQQQKPPQIPPLMPKEADSNIPPLLPNLSQQKPNLDTPPKFNKPEAVDEENEPPHIQTPSQRERDNWGDNFDRKPHQKRGAHHGPVGRNNFHNKPYRDEPYFPGPPVDEYMPSAVAYPPIVDRPPDKNDCEIIVVSKALTEYAEFIEGRLKQLGLIVDLLFPNEDVPIGKVLANISSRGCLYAILVMPQNEENRSLTLNVLHGIPQEHRNMPVEDALILILRNFEAYMRGETIPAEKLGEMSLLDKHPIAMQMALNMLAENRQLTSSQYDKLIKYLQDKRDLQYQFEVAEGIDQESQESTSKQAELQSRIMNILNKSAEAPIPMSITSSELPPVPAPDNTPTPLLKDPTVQKALDSFLGDMFKNMSGA